MRNIAAGLKRLVCCVLVTLGAIVLLATLPVVAMLLMIGPLLAVVGLIVSRFHGCSCCRDCFHWTTNCHGRWSGSFGNCKGFYQLNDS